MKFRAHFKEEGKPNNVGDPVDGLDGEITTGPLWFIDEEAVKVWLHNQLGQGKITRTFNDYTAVPYDDEGNMLEKVNDTDRDLAKADAQALVSKSKHIRDCCSALLAARQMYAVAMTELPVIIEQTMLTGTEAAPADRHAHPLALEVLIQSVGDTSKLPFDQLNLLDGLNSEIMPWLKTLIGRNTKQDLADRKANQLEMQKVHREIKVPIGVTPSPELDAYLTKGTSLVLVGYGPAVRVLLNHIVTTVLAVREPKHPNQLFTAIRLCDEAEIKPSVISQLALVGRSHWAGCARNYDKWAHMVQNYIFPQVKMAPDLLVVDDLAACAEGKITVPGHAPGAFDGGLAPYKAADAHRILLKWVTGSAMALVAGIPSPNEKPINTGSFEWERLNTHAVVRPVTVIRTRCPGHEDIPEGQVRLVVGKDAFKLDIDPVLLEAKSKIILN